MFDDLPHPIEIRLATMGAGLALTVLGLANGIAGADDGLIPTTPDPGTFPTPAAAAPSTGDVGLTMPSMAAPTAPSAVTSPVSGPNLTMPSAGVPSTLSPGTATPPANGALLPSLLIDTGTFLGQLGNALGSATASAPGA